MKTLGMMLASVAAPLRRRDARIFLWLLLALVVLVVGFAAVFHQLMALEGESYSWATGIYWVLVTMSTLGFGDIVFASEAGRIFSVIVLRSTPRVSIKASACLRRGATVSPGFCRPVVGPWK